MWNSINHYAWVIRAICIKRESWHSFSETGGTWPLYVESSSSANMHVLQSYRQFQHKTRAQRVTFLISEVVKVFQYSIQNVGRSISNRNNIDEVQNMLSKLQHEHRAALSFPLHSHWEHRVKWVGKMKEVNVFVRKYCRKLAHLLRHFKILS